MISAAIIATILYWNEEGPRPKLRWLFLGKGRYLLAAVLLVGAGLGYLSWRSGAELKQLQAEVADQEEHLRTDLTSARDAVGKRLADPELLDEIKRELQDADVQMRRARESYAHGDKSPAEMRETYRQYLEKAMNMRDRLSRM